MKSLKILIIIFIIILIVSGVLFYMNSRTEEVTAAEEYHIKQYISGIYGWQEIYGHALPTFNNINEADEVWLWDVVKMQLLDSSDKYEFTHEEIMNKAKEIYGKDLNKIFPIEGRDFLHYNESIGKYEAIGMGLDDYDDKYVIDSIKKKNNKYIVEIIEYQIDYTNIHQENEDEFEYDIYITDLKGNNLATYSNNTSQEILEAYVLDNKDLFHKKTITINKEESNLYTVQSVNE